MPFITEEIWQRVAPLAQKKEKTIMLAAYPNVDETLFDKVSEKEIEWIKNIVISVRTVRSEMNIPPSKALPVLFKNATTHDRDIFDRNHTLITTLAKLESVTWLTKDEAHPESATALVGHLEILIPMAGLINKEEESARLNREISKLKKEIERAELKLQNPSFSEKAPKDIVEKERAKLKELKTVLMKLEQQLQR